MFYMFHINDIFKKAAFYKANSLKCSVQFYLFFKKRWSKFVEEHHRKSPKERAAERDALNTGKFFSEALILVSTNPQYDNRLFMVCNSMSNLLSYCGLIDAKIRASDKDLPVQKQC